MDPRTGTVLVVCTANICRSPLADRILQRVLAGSGVAMGSAGVRAQVGSGMCPLSAEQLLPGDPFARTHRAKALDRPMIEAADLVLVMEREQRSPLVRASPGSQAKVFTLREATAFAEALLERGDASDEIGSVAQLASAMQRLRGVVPPPERPEARRRLFRQGSDGVDPLTIKDGHGFSEPAHRAATVEVHDMATRFGRAAKVLLGV